MQNIKTPRNSVKWLIGAYKQTKCNKYSQAKISDTTSTTIVNIDTPKKG